MPDRSDPTSADVFDHPAFDDHEQVLFCRDAQADLFGIIAIHSTRLGPAAGGCRMRPYASTEAALADVLRLSRGMTLKNAVAGLPLGGGKAVVIGDPADPRKEARLRAFARHIQTLQGRYWTAIDMGVGPADADLMAEECDYVFARASDFPDGFQTSQYTALGGFTSLRAVVLHTLGKDHLDGVRVAVQGVGGTGRDLCRQLHEAGADLFVADLDPSAVEFAREHYGARVVPPDRIHAQPVDVFAPCAHGGVLNDETIPEIRARAVCGVANNQLAEPRHGDELRARGVVYAPDFVVNAGGVIASARVIFARVDRERATEQILALHDTILSILERAEASGRAPGEIAEDLARERLEAAPAVGR